jgi:hypothetical protein
MTEDDHSMIALYALIVEIDERAGEEALASLVEHLVKERELEVVVDKTAQRIFLGVYGDFLSLLISGGALALPERLLPCIRRWYWMYEAERTAGLVGEDLEE